MRRCTLLGAALALVGLLPGCAAEGPAAVPQQDAAAGFPRQVQTALGAVEIPARPQRIVTLGSEKQVVLALGLTPVGVAKSFYGDGVEPFLADDVAGKDITLLNTASGVPYEQVAALRPDVILAGTYSGVSDEYARLSQIAPVVSFRRGPYVDTWQEQATLIGEALGEEAKAAEVVGELESRIADVAKRHPSWQGRTFTLSFNYEPGKITTVVAPDDFAIRLIGQLGFVLAPGVRTLEPAVEGGQPDVSYELVTTLDADAMMLAHASPELRAQLESSPVFTGHPAVAGGRYVPVDLTTVTALRTPMVLGIHHVLDQLVPQLERAVG